VLSATWKETATPVRQRQDRDGVCRVRDEVVIGARKFFIVSSIGANTGTPTKISLSSSYNSETFSRRRLLDLLAIDLPHNL
jgi:hypothetical protein